jgi:hypothetical protein
VFCGRKPFSEEHVWPEWLIKELPDAIDVRGRMTDHTTGRTIEFPSGTKVNKTIRRTCNPCNTGWMADLESETKWIVAPMLRGQHPIRLGLAEQRLVALWAVKTALMLELASPGPAAIPASLYRRIYAERVPPPETRVWLGARTVLDDVPADATEAAVELLYAESGPTTFALSQGDLEGYASTFAANFFVCQVVGLLPPDENRPVEFGAVREGPFLHIWPTTERLLSWPPAFLLDREGVVGATRLDGPAALVFRYL